MDKRTFAHSVGVRLLLATSLLFHCVFHASAEMRFQSGERQTQLIELYTSEGCSSCPPADRWLSRYKNDPGLWTVRIPVAFHVDYWDYIGWPDRFARKEYSLRQRDHERKGNIKQVYTPGFVVDGVEWRGWWTARFGVGKKPPLPNSKPGVLELVVNKDNFTARFDARKKPQAQQTLTVAILGSNLTTAVKAGENKGEELKHDFVVLALQNYISLEDSAEWQGTLPPAMSALSRNAELAVAAWVSDGQSLRPIQAVAGWLLHSH